MTAPPSVLRPPPQIYFGDGVRNLVGEVTAGHGRRAAVCLDEWLVGHRLGSAILRAIEDAGVAVATTVVARPSFDGIRLRVHTAGVKAAGADVVVAVGGGSTIDTAKLIAVGLTVDRPYEQMYGELRVGQTVAPVVALPTTAGTGSEVSPVAVLDDDRGETKVGISDPALIPVAALCDPHLTLTAPAGVTAQSGLDAMTHAIESYTARPRATVDGLRREVFHGRGVLTDQFALEAVANLGTNLPAAVADGRLSAARAGCLLGSLQAGLAFAQTGTGAAHALQYPLGALTHTPHGLGVGLLMPYVMAYNSATMAERLARLGRASGLVAEGQSAGEAAQRFVMGFHALVRSLGQPTGLGDIGVTGAHLDGLADKAAGIDRLLRNNGRPIDRTGLLQVLAAALRDRPDDLLEP